MNIDRLPDNIEDPSHAADTTHLTEPSPPEAPPPPDNASRAEPSPAVSQSREDPQATERRGSTEQAVRAEDSTEQSNTTDSRSEQLAEPEETPESRSRQEHANHALPPDVASESAEPLDGTNQEEAPSAEATPTETEDSASSDDAPVSPNDHFAAQSEDSNVQGELPGEAAAEPDNDTGYGDKVGDRSRPLASLEHEDRTGDVEDRLAKAHAADLASDHQHTTDPDRQQWTAERDRIHGEIIRDIYSEASSVPCEYRAIIAGGLPGAGKSTVLSAQLGIDQSRYLTINPDDIKEEIARRGLVPEIEGLSPMEASDLVHEESSIIAKQLAHRAQLDGKNLIWDITMSSQASTQERIDDLRSAGYNRIDAVFVDIPIETSIRRTQARHREGHDMWRAGKGLGGRYVPPEVILRQTDPDWGSKNRKHFEAAKVTASNWIVLDNSVDGNHAIIVESSKPKNANYDSPEEWAR
jgi:predicted ABC-type ATPase